MCSDLNDLGALFRDEQFGRAVANGALAILEPRTREAILQAYSAISRANQRILAEVNQDPQNVVVRVTNAAIEAIRVTAPKVKMAHDTLLRLLSSE